MDVISFKEAREAKENIKELQLSTSKRIGDLEELINEKWTYDETAIKSVKVDSAVDADTVNGKTVEIAVPSNAKFTDTVTTINGKTGAIAKADIVALGIPAQDTVYTHPTTAGNKHIPPGGAEGKILGYGGSSGIAEWVDKPESGGKRTARFVVGTSTAGWTAADVDYLCDGVDDQVEINAAIQTLPEGGGEIVILDGTYNITAKIDVNKDNVSVRGNGNATILKRMWNSSEDEGVITLKGVKGCRVEGLQIDGNRVSYTSNRNHGIYLSFSSNENTVTGNTCNNNDYGIYLGSSSNNTVTGNTCNNNYCGIYLGSSSNNTVTGNTCVRGTGTPEDYTLNQYTMRLYGTKNDYNLISSNNCMGKAVTSGGGTGNTLVNNKFDAS